MTGETFPRTVAEITPAWLTGALERSGALAGGRVAKVTAEPLGIGLGFMSAMQRLTLDYDSQAPDAPRRLIAKLAPLDPGARQIDLVFKFYEKETGFYRVLQKDSPIRTPHAYHVEFDPESHDFILLMEDLSPARLGDHLVGMSPADAGLALDAAAAFHGRWWNSPRLAEMPWLLEINSPQMKALQAVYQQCWPAVVDFLGDGMPAAMKRTGEKLATRIEAMMDLAADMPRTIMHGDYRADNMFFEVGEAKEPFAIADWQVMLEGPAAFDLAYMVSGSLKPDIRRACQDDLVVRHHAGLVKAGVSDYSLKDLQADYRVCATLGWCWPVVAIGSLDMANERGVATFYAWAERVMGTVLDLDGGAVIP